MKRTWQIGNILALVFALVANFIVGAQVLDLPSISAISSEYVTYLTPAGYAFSIWSFIYVLLIAFVVYQARDILKPRSENKLPGLVGPYFIIASIANGLWTYVFVNEFTGLSVLILLLLTASLYMLLSRLRIALDDKPLKEVAFVWWPLMIYAGWVTVASVVNVASWLDSVGVVITPIMASLALILLAACLMALLFTRHVRELVLACIWGVVAIGVEQLQQEGSQTVWVSAFVVSGALLVCVLIHAYKQRKTHLLGELTS